MRDNINIIKKLFVIQLFTVSFLTLSAEPYRVYPILFVHGINSGSGTWGAPVYDREMGDSIRADSIASTYQQFLEYMNPFAIEWWKIDKSYTHPDSSPAYPNKTFLEVVNMDAPWGSIDDDYIPGGGYDSPDYTSWQDELWHRINEVIEEYYGEGDWEDDLNAKVILIGHSMGALASRQAILLFPFSCWHLV